jgi:hypothetical protein
MMKVSFGLKVHSGWAILVVVGEPNGHLAVVDCRRMELTDEMWARQPYHAARNLEPNAAHNLIKCGFEAAHEIASRHMRETVIRERGRGNEVSGCGVLVGNPMPDWSVEEIIAVHVRMHRAEGALFRNALVDAAKAAGLRVSMIPEKMLTAYAQNALRTPGSALTEKITTLGKAAGAPWGKDQKEAALAALIALQPAGRT